MVASSATLREMSQETQSQLAWIDPAAQSGEVFRLGDDVVYRDGPRRLRVVALSTPDKVYRRAFVEAVSVVAAGVGDRVQIVLDFSSAAPPGPGQAVGLCRDLHASGDVERIVILRHPDMPAWLLSAVSKILQTAGLPVDIEEAT